MNLSVSKFSASWLGSVQLVRDERAGAVVACLFAPEPTWRSLSYCWRACMLLHGYVRATMDVDLLVAEDLKNHSRIIAALSELEDHAAAESRMWIFRMST